MVRPEPSIKRSSDEPKRTMDILLLRVVGSKKMKKYAVSQLHKLFLTLGGFLLISGCSTYPVKMENSEMVRLKEMSVIHAVHTPSPSFIVHTPGTVIVPLGVSVLAWTGLTVGAALSRSSGALIASFGIPPLGALTSYKLSKNEGKRVMQEYPQTDPVLRVKEGFLASLDSDLEMKNVIDVHEVLADGGIDDLKARFKTGAVFEFKTIKWGLTFTRWSHFRVMYSAAGRLVRLENDEVLWQGSCRFIEGEPEPNRPTLEEFVANNGALLRAKLLEAADQCMQQLFDQFTGEEQEPATTATENAVNRVMN